MNTGMLFIPARGLTISIQRFGKVRPVSRRVKSNPIYPSALYSPRNNLILEIRPIMSRSNKQKRRFMNNKAYDQLTSPLINEEDQVVDVDFVCDFDYSKLGCLNQITFINCRFGRLQYLGLYGVTFNGCEFMENIQYCNLNSAMFEQCTGVSNFVFCNMQNVGFKNCDLTGTHFETCDIDGATYEDCILRYAVFGTCYTDGGGKFINCNLKNVRLRGTTFGTDWEFINTTRFLDWRPMSEVGYDSSFMPGRCGTIHNSYLKDTGVAYYSITFPGHGETGRTLSAFVYPDDVEPTFCCGCFNGNEKELRDYINAEYDDPAVHKSRTFALETPLKTIEFDRDIRQVNNNKITRK
ncbi:hypothetical protein EniLVp02_0217 [Vibrio phage EniLVp02]